MFAGMAELADAQASGACGSNIVWVQVPFPALSLDTCVSGLFLFKHKVPSFVIVKENLYFLWTHTGGIIFNIQIVLVVSVLK